MSLTTCVIAVITAIAAEQVSRANSAKTGQSTSGTLRCSK